MSDLNLLLKETYPHPVRKVWEAITTQAGLQAWLMPNDFRLIEGHESTFRFCSAGDGPPDSEVAVRVVEFEAPVYMVWRWRNEGESEDSTVTFRLREVEGGCELSLQHTGPVSDRLARELSKGWPAKLAALEAHLNT